MKDNFNNWIQDIKNENPKLFDDKILLKAGISKDRLTQFKNFALMLLIDKNLE